MRDLVSPLDGFRSPFGAAASGGVATPPSFSSQTVYEGQTILGVDLASFYTNGADGWAVQSGSLPAGVSISIGQLTGAPTTAGSYSAVIRGTNSGDSGTQDNTFAFTVNEWYTGGSAAYDTSNLTTTGSDVDSINDLVGSRDLALRGSNPATVSGSVVSFTQANNVAYNATVTSALGSDAAYAFGFSGTVTSASNAFTIPIARSHPTTGAHYARIDLDGGALQVDPLIKDAATTVRNSSVNEVDVFDNSSAELNLTQVATDAQEIWASYQGFPIAYDRRNTTATVLGNTISDNRFSIMGHTATSPTTSWTGTFDGAWEITDGSSPTPALASRIAGAIGGKSGNFTARPGIVVAGIGNSEGAGTSPGASNPETVDAARGFSVLDLSTDDTQYFTYDLRAPLSHFRAPDWTNSGGDYARGDYVYQTSNVYYCLADHTPGTFATDLGNNLWIAATGREDNLSQGFPGGVRGADPASSSDGKNNIGRADPQVYMLNQIVTDSDAFVIYAGAHDSGSCLARETAADNGGIDYWLSASDAGGSGRTSLWDTHLTKLQKIFEVADATPAIHTPFKVLAVGALGGQEARGASNYAGGSNIITPAQYQTYLEAFVARAFSALGVDMILYARASVDLSYVNGGDDSIFATFQAIETAVAAAEPRFVLGCPGHIDPGNFPDFTVDADGAWASSVAGGGTQIYIGTPGSGDQLHTSAAYKLAEGRYNAGLVLAEYRRQRHGAGEFEAGAPVFLHLKTDDAYVFTDAARTTPANAGDPVGGWTDLTGNGYHASATGSARPTYQSTPNRLTIDTADDVMTVTVPTGGWVGTLVLGTDQGTASYDVSIPAGSYDIGGKGGLYFPGTAIVGGVKIGDGVMTAAQKTVAEAAMVALGATASYGAVTNFANYWRNRTEFTGFPLVDTSSATDLTLAWANCSNLASFPLVDTSSVINFVNTWGGCSGLTSFPLLDTSNATNVSGAWSNCSGLVSFPALILSAGTNFANAWQNCTSLTTFPANMFDTNTVGQFASAFTNTNLSETSIDNILVSLDTAGITTGTRVFNQSGGSAPSATGEAAIDSMRADGWTVTVTGGY